MVVAENSSIYEVLLSSVVPAAATVDKAVHELGNMDLAMKLHYLRGVYYFAREAVEGLDIYSLKKPMFKLLEIYSGVAGRIRKTESGRPFIKCNDSGVRIIEAKCDMSLEEWLGLKDTSLHKQLVSNAILGPDLAFSPLVLLQFTWFKCGGMSVGMSWSHVLGDAVSASHFMNMWGEIIAATPESHVLPLKSAVTAKPEATHIVKPTEPPFLAVKEVEPVGDCWKVADSYRMETVSFQIPGTQMKQLLSRVGGGTDRIQPFEALSAIIWQCISKIRNKNEPSIVTVCRGHSERTELLGSEQVLGTVKVDFSVAETEILELATSLSEGIEDEREIIEEQVAKETALDFIVYGGNLTFVDLEGVDLYGLRLNGKRPVYVYYNVDGVGPEGVVLVIASPESGAEGSRGRTVTVTLPENEISQLKSELNRDWGLSVKKILGIDTCI